MTFEAKIIARLLKAIEECERVGCINHLDCWEESGAEWNEPIARAKEFLKTCGIRETGNVTDWGRS